MDMEIIAPEEAHLECDIDIGDPPAKLVWYKDNKEIRPGGKYTIEYGEEIATLVIRDTTTSDAGSYRCEAANKLGRVETECTMVVQSKLQYFPPNDFYNVVHILRWDIFKYANVIVKCSLSS